MTEPYKKKVDIGIVTVLTDCELPALLYLFGKSIDKPSFTVEGARYWFGSIHSEIESRDFEIAITAVGQAGTSDASAVTTSLIHRFSPSLVCLVGIAAGVKEDVSFGDVVFSQNVLGYQYRKRKPDPDPDSLRPRHESPDFDLLEDVKYFNSSYRYEEWKSIIDQYLKELKGKDLPVKKLLPKRQKGIPATIASGDEVFGDGSLPDLKKRYGDDTIKAGEMEGIGFAIAAIRGRTSWVIIRSISDYGDPQSKDDRYKDRFHNYASISAASYLYMFLKHGFRGKQDSLAGVEEHIFSGAPHIQVRTALITVHDKHNLDILLEYFKSQNIKVIATPNTAKYISNLGYDVQTTFEYTKTAPLLSTRGTLHPYILAGIMSHISDREQVAELSDKSLDSIDLVFINSRDLEINERMSRIEIMDKMAQLQIGGPALLRWTLKQWRTSVAVVDPVDYIALLDDMKNNNNILTTTMRERLLRRAMKYIEEKDRETSEAFKLLWPTV